MLPPINNILVGSASEPFFRTFSVDMHSREFVTVMYGLGNLC